MVNEMDEKRKFFRIKNMGEIQAHSDSYNLDVVEISSGGAVVIKKNIYLPKHGTIAIKINTFTMDITYEILRTVKNTMILIFVNEDEISQLFTVLKQVRNEQMKSESR